MRLITDRPGPISYVHPSGVKARIEFEWGSPGDLVPHEVLVKVSDQIVCSATGPWGCFADARRHGIEMATLWCDRHHP